MTRREFLKYMGFGLAGLMIPTKTIEQIKTDLFDQVINVLYGRITQSGHKLYKEPDQTADVIQSMDKDSVWRITGVRINKANSTNPIWFELDYSGFAHSSRVQPVRKIRNKPGISIPKDGCLGEITMPFVDAYSSVGKNQNLLYRFYYSATFWILDVVIDHDMKIWYKLLDDRTYAAYYIPADHMRLVPNEELTPISPNISFEDKKIIVDLPSQVLTAYEEERLVFQTKISSGIRLLEGGFATPKGIYRVMRKRPCRHMANPTNGYGSGFDLPGVPWVSYFIGDGIALHGTYWHNDYGNPSSHGCVNMTPQTSKWIYRWTTPIVPPDNYYYSGTDGTRVIIQ